MDGGTAAVKRAKQKAAWTTADEIAYVDGLGKWVGLALGKRGLLQRYLDGMQLRAKWKGIDRDAVERRVRELIQRIDAKRAV
jgi:hypothetical protein